MTMDSRHGRTGKKLRLDSELVRRGLVDTRNKAKALIMAGQVYVDGERVDKAGTLIHMRAQITLKEDSLKFVSRGGLKLEAALESFNLDVRERTALDVGASTGGFTDCLLQFGAKKVYAIDVGYGQLDWKLRNDPRVVVMEKVNARYLKPEDIGEPADIAVVDVSFISLTKIIPPVIKLLKTGAVIVALIKPQFEVGKGEVGKGGIVRDEAKRKEVVDKISCFVKDEGLNVIGVIESPVLGAEGNKEFLIAAKLSS